jgi:hypothetical protein
VDTTPSLPVTVEKEGDCCSMIGFAGICPPCTGEDGTRGTGGGNVSGARVIIVTGTVTTSPTELVDIVDEMMVVTPITGTIGVERGEGVTTIMMTGVEIGPLLMGVTTGID